EEPADAAPWPLEERIIRAAVALRSVVTETLRIEGFRVLPGAGIAVCHIRAEDERRTTRDANSVDHIVLIGAAEGTPERGIQPQDLIDDHPGVGKFSEIFINGVAVADHLIDLGADAFRDLRIAREHAPRPNE